MSTPARDRLAALFGDVAMPTPPPDGTKTFAEKELEAQMVGHPVSKPTSQAPQSRDQHNPKTQPAANVDVLTSSDEEDDYISAFSSKLAMKKVTPTNSRSAKPKAHSQPHQSRRQHAENLDLNSLLTQDLPTADKRDRPAVGHFCPFNMVAKFPYKYMDDANGRVSRHFFANGKIYEREWDLYYLHGPENSLLQPMTLLPYEQVKSLIDEIALTFKAKILVPKFPFTVSFFEDGTPQPQFLGTCTSRADINDRQESIPAPASGHGEPPVSPSELVESSYADFKTKFETAQGAAKKSKSSAAKKKKAADRSAQVRAWCHSLTHAQKYFGLRPAPAKLPVAGITMSWDEQLALYAKTSDAIPATVGPLDLDKPAPFPFDRSPVLVSIDVEAYERGHHLITEVGVSTLDTLDLCNIEPGESGKNWRQQIRSRHFRIQEHAYLRNTEFCRGDPEAFQFGESEFVGLKDIGSVIDSCFEWPYSVQYTHNGELKMDNSSWGDLTEKDETATGDGAGAGSTDKEHLDLEELQKGPKERSILLVGHGIKGDLDYLSALDSSIFSAAAAVSNSAASYPPQNKIDLSGLDDRSLRRAKGLSSIREALDTANLYQALMHDQNPRSLAAILSDLDIRGFYLHNGGNDARYTLEALVAMIIKARQMEDEKAASQAAEAAAAIKAWNN